MTETESRILDAVPASTDQVIWASATLTGTSGIGQAPPSPDDLGPEVPAEPDPEPDPGPNSGLNSEPGIVEHLNACMFALGTLAGALSAAGCEAQLVQDNGADLPHLYLSSPGLKLVPIQFTLTLPVFVGEDPVTIEAKLRWDVEKTEPPKLKLGFSLMRVQTTIEQAVEGVVERLKAADCPIFFTPI